MNDNEPIMMDMESCVNYIAEKTGMSEHDILAVLDAETEYMRELGIIEFCEEE